MTLINNPAESTETKSLNYITDDIYLPRMNDVFSFVRKITANYGTLLNKLAKNDSHFNKKEI